MAHPTKRRNRLTPTLNRIQTKIVPNRYPKEDDRKLQKHPPAKIPSIAQKS
jgi:hypothetical protein